MLLLLLLSLLLLLLPSLLVLFVCDIINASLSYYQYSGHRFLFILGILATFAFVFLFVLMYFHIIHFAVITFSGIPATRTQIICLRSWILEWKLLLTSASSMCCSKSLVSCQPQPFYQGILSPYVSSQIYRKQPKHRSDTTSDLINNPHFSTFSIVGRGKCCLFSVREDWIGVPWIRNMYSRGDGW